MENKPNSVIRATSGSRNKRKYALGIGASVVLLVIAVTISIKLTRRTDTSLPSSIIRATSFALYYPSPLPSGYIYKNHSAKIESGIVFYELQGGSRTITISEQAVPSNPPSLAHLTNFTNLQTPAGNTAVGTSLGKPVGIILSNTTLVTITGTKTVPSDIVSTIAKTMVSLPQ